jgi:hypothetical protein
MSVASSQYVFGSHVSKKMKMLIDWPKSGMVGSMFERTGK